MNWFDEGSLYSQIGLFLREDLGRGDITTQSVVARNTRARGRFVAGEKMIVAGLEAAEEVFLTLDSQQQLEAFVADGEEIEPGKVIARTIGFADVLLSGERVALNLIQRLSAIATTTSEFVRAIEGTNAAIVDTRQTTPGMRMLEKYAVQLGGGQNHRFGLDDGVVIRANHIAMSAGIGEAVSEAKSKLGHVHKIAVQIANETEIEIAIKNGADILLLDGIAPDTVRSFASVAHEQAPNVVIECTGNITMANVREYADAGADIIAVPAITNSSRSMTVTFQLQPF